MGAGERGFLSACKLSKSSPFGSVARRRGHIYSFPCASLLAPNGNAQSDQVHLSNQPYRWVKHFAHRIMRCAWPPMGGGAAPTPIPVQTPGRTTLSSLDQPALTSRENSWKINRVERKAYPGGRKVLFEAGRQIAWAWPASGTLPGR